MSRQQEFGHKIRLYGVEVITALASLGVGLFLGCMIGFFAGERPERVVQIIFDGAFGTPYDIGMVLYLMTILIATGLAVAVPLQAGFFNIGGEGQVLVAAFAAGLIGSYGPIFLPHHVAVFVALVFSILAAGAWGALSGWIRAYRGGHEVISGIMLNFVAAGFTSWLVVSFLQAADSQNPELNTIHDTFKLARWVSFDGAPATYVLFIALAAVLIFAVVLKNLSTGYHMKVVKRSPEAALTAGIDLKKTMFWSMACGSSACGIAGAVMVLGESWRFRIDMADGFGFLGIPVALLGKGRPLGIVLAAALFAVLHHGSALLDIESSKVGRDLAQVIEAVIVLSVVVMPSIVQKILNPRSDWAAK